MTAYEIATIVLAVIVAISGVAWGRLWQRGKKIVNILPRIR